MNTNNQQLAFDKFAKLKVGALFMQMGTGKTKVALDLVKYNKIDYLLYITPFSTKSNIKNEFEKWGVNCDYDIVGYESISSSDRLYLEIFSKLSNKKCFIVADESIFIKNEETKRFKRLCNLREKCDYALILNGTPLTKNEWDLYNQMFFLSPKILGMNRTQFLSTFFKKITYKKKEKKEKEFYIFSEINAELLSKMIEPYIFRCKLDFDKEEIEEKFYTSYDGEDYYEIKAKFLQEYKKNRDSEVIIKMINILNKISSTYYKKNDKIIEYIKNKKIICYCNFLEEVEYISSKLDCYVIIGKTKNRNEIIEKFKNDNKPLIMTFGVGSYSLNLQFCNEIVYSSINFDYSKMEQSKYRIKRKGQENNIKYTYFLTTLGINNLILKNIEKKITLEKLIKQKIKEGCEEEWIKSM